MFYDFYSRTRMLSTDVNVQSALMLGYVWIEPYMRNWNKTLRNPTIGTVVQLSKYPQSFRSVKLDSPQGRRMLKRLAW